VKPSTAVVAVLLVASGAAAQSNVSKFCASRTTAAYHSPKCDWGWVVHDPNRVEDVKIPHRPPYHTYSRWKIGGGTYILAYRDIDMQPDDMEADVYLAREAHYKLVGRVPRLTQVVTGVFTARLTGGILPDLVFRLDSGELHWMAVVRFPKGKAKEVFWYGTSEMEIVTHPKPAILAKSSLPNLVQEFRWDPKSSRFVLVHERPWHIH
jgi:hypothetical protein